MAFTPALTARVFRVTNKCALYPLLSQSGSKFIHSSAIASVNEDFVKANAAMRAREQEISPRRKVAVIGAAGNVGASVVSSIIGNSYPVDLMVVDVNEKLARGQANDLADAAWQTVHTVRYADSKEAGEADLIIVTAGAKQKPGESRDNLLGRNASILTSILKSMNPINPNAVIMMIANPVDVLTGIAQNVTGLPHNQVFGSGTLLDSGRLRNTLAKVINVRQTSVQCHVLGEHGDNQFVGWSSARVNGVKLDEFPEMKYVDREKLEKDTSRKAYDIIEAKGSTYYGIGACGATIAKAVLENSHDVYPVSCFSEKYNGYVCTPAIVGSSGIFRTLNVELNQEEKGKMERAIKNIKDQTMRFIK